MRRLIFLALVALALASTTGTLSARGSKKVQVTIHSTPEGAVVTENGTTFGATPVTLVYQFAEFKTCQLTKALTVTWTSGASDALMNFVTANAATLMTMVGPQRVVMWEEQTGIDNKVLYLSAGAVSVLNGLHVRLPNPRKVAPSALPEGRVMMLGDATDWDK